MATNPSEATAQRRRRAALGGGGAATTILITAMLAAGASRASAANVVLDTWQDADRTQPAPPAYSEYGTDADADGDIESAWFNGGTGASAVASTGHLLFTIPTGSGSWTTYFTPEATPVTLAAAGDFVRVTWTFKTGDVNTSNTSQNFRAAFVDTSSAARLTVDGAPGPADFPGYALFGNMGETTGNGNSFQLRERAVTNSDLLAASGNWAALGNGLGNNATGYADSTVYTFVWTLTRNASNGLDISMTMSGGNIGGTGSVAVNVTDATPNSFVYDTFALRPSGNATSATSLDTTLFQVETNTVPEPASVATLFLMLGGGTALSRRSRRGRP